MSEIEKAVDAAVADRIDACRCNNRHRCQYHEGMSDGAEMALRTVKESTFADVSDWLAGA